MAFLLDLNTQNPCFLYAHHVFGRLDDKVDTLLAGPQFSRHHATILWQQNCWKIRDFSQNGIWLNGSKIQPMTPHPLSTGDKIAFASPNDELFLVADLSAPCDLLLPHNEKITSTTKVINLNQYNFLPDAEHPELIVFFDNQQWFVEVLNRQKVQAVKLNENALIEFSGQSWQLKRCHHTQATIQLAGPQHRLSQLIFMFDLSLDEEQTHLSVEAPDETIDFCIRSHHDLTVNLARYKAADALKGLDSEHQGWRDPQTLLKDLGIDYEHSNIQVFRARKQLAESLNICDAQGFIERHRGKMRFGGSQFKISKGQQIECELPHPE
ncbi:MAG: FHA domain-containing protein [Algicola sp.]|nr:FHA domain-containing protein [Algicola sp.]